MRKVFIKKISKLELHKKVEMFKFPLKCEVLALSEFLNANKKNGF